MFTPADLPARLLAHLEEEGGVGGEGVDEEERGVLHDPCDLVDGELVEREVQLCICVLGYVIVRMRTAEGESWHVGRKSTQPQTDSL